MMTALLAVLLLVPAASGHGPWLVRGPDPTTNPTPAPAPARLSASAPGVRSAPVNGRWPGPAQQTDGWFGEDKQRHLAMAFFTTTFGHAAARVAGIESGTATALGVAAAAAASLGKEFFDRRTGGPFSFRDLVWDAAGIALGAVLVEAAR